MVDNEITVVTNKKELETALMNSTDPEEMQKIIEMFNIDLKKRDIIRRNKINDIQDMTLDNINQRLICEPDSFSNKDLLECTKAMQTAAAGAEALAATSPVQLTQVNIDNRGNKDTLPRDSRARVNDVISQILNGTNMINGDD